MSRILLIEDHERMARLIHKGLVAAGIGVDVADRIDAAWTAVQQMSYQASSVRLKIEQIQLVSGG